jgi:hypothetical protein
MKPGTPALERLRQEDCEFEASLGWILKKEKMEGNIYILHPNLLVFSILITHCLSPPVGST